MSRHQILAKTLFGCGHCGSKNLIGNGAVRVDDNRIFIAYVCDDCGEDVPIDVQSILTELFDLTTNSTIN